MSSHFRGYLLVLVRVLIGISAILYVGNLGLEINVFRHDFTSARTGEFSSSAGMRSMTVCYQGHCATTPWRWDMATCSVSSVLYPVFFVVAYTPLLIGLFVVWYLLKYSLTRNQERTVVYLMLFLAMVGHFGMTFVLRLWVSGCYPDWTRQIKYDYQLEALDMNRFFCWPYYLTMCLDVVLVVVWSWRKTIYDRTTANTTLRDIESGIDE